MHQRPVPEIELVGRLVEDEDIRPGDEHGAKGGHLQLAARKLMCPPFRQMAHAEPVENAIDSCLDFGFPKPARLEAKGDVVADDRQDDLVLRRLEDVAHFAEHGFGVADGIEPIDGDTARRRLGEPVDQPRECRLAGTVEPDHADPPLAERQAERQKGCPCAEIDAGIVEADIQAAGPLPWWCCGPIAHHGELSN